jgi:hypothetical protein
VEIATLASLYGVYELVRGQGHATLAGARAHTDAIVSLERHVHVYGEHALQRGVDALPGLPTLLGLAYILLHFVGTAVVLTWIHRRHRSSFPVVRNTLILSTAVALTVYVLFPVAPPRLAGLGFGDTVSSGTHVNLSSDMLGSLYNPFAAVPSLHFGYALLVGGAIGVLATRRWVRVLGWTYPALMLLTIVGTGNHFFFDAASGGTVVALSFLVVRRLSRSDEASALPHRSPPVEVGEVDVAGGRDQLVHVERDAAEVDGGAPALRGQHGVLAYREERRVAHGLGLRVLVDEADAPGAQPERAAHATQPLQMDVPRGDDVALDGDLGRRGLRQHDGLVRGGRGVAADEPQPVEVDLDGWLEAA